MTQVGILSTAHVHTAGFAKRLTGMPNVEFVGLTDDDHERGRLAAERLETTFRSTDALLESVDGAIVCSTNTTHRRWVERCADAGVHVLCEKPLATTLHDAKAMVERCRASGVQLGLCMPLPFSEPARQAKRRFESGEIGDLKLAIGTNRAWLRDRHLTGWSADPDAAGGGAVMDHTVHLVNLFRWITGEEIEEVYAALITMHEELAVEDINVLSMRSSSGAPFSLDGSWNRPDNWDYWGDAGLRLIGTRGTIEVECFDQTLTLTRDPGGIAKQYWGADPDARMLADFVAAIQDDRPPETSGEIGVRDTAVVVSAYASDEHDTPIQVEDVRERG